MSNLRKAAQALVNQWESNTAYPFGSLVDALRAALAQPEQEPYPLPESLYPDSKDWVASDYAGRVEWLHFMYESKKREVEQLETTLLRAALAQPDPVEVREGWEYIREKGLLRKPLADEQIQKLMDEEALWKFARAIERAHGIGGEHE
jgi:hypothetical protein